MKKLNGYMRGIGIGGWLTNYKRMAQIPKDKQMDVTIGDMEHFASYITEWDVANIASFGVDHIRLAFDQLALEKFEEPYVWNYLSTPYDGNRFSLVDDDFRKPVSEKIIDMIRIK